MQGSIIAKFRCIELTASWNTSERARLVPVMATEFVQLPDGSVEKQASPENARFWNATPSGEANVTCGSYTSSERRGGTWVEVRKPYPTPAGFFTVGRTYWVRVSPTAEAPEGNWALEVIEPRPGGSLRVRWSRGASSVQMDIENRGAIPIVVEDFFAQYLAAARNPSGSNRIDTAVDVTFEPTE